MSTDVMIYTNDLAKSFGSFRAVDKINFEVRRGEVVGFLGPNGAGKSTTMRILTCFISPTGGVARIHGHDVFDEPLKVRETLGYLPQRAPLYLEMSVLEYLRFAADLRQIDDSTFKKRAKNVVEICGLAQVLGKEIRHLSHGYRQRVGLAQALIHDPPILILDEPTSDLDPNEKAEFLEYLKQIGKERTVLLSTHNLNEVEQACARAIIISKGRIVADGPLDEIRAKSGKVRYVVSVQDAAGDALPRQVGPEEGRGRERPSRGQGRRQGPRNPDRRARPRLRARRRQGQGPAARPLPARGRQGLGPPRAAQGHPDARRRLPSPHRRRGPAQPPPRRSAGDGRARRRG